MLGLISSKDQPPSGKCFLSDHEIKKQRSFANLDLFGSVTGTVLMPKGIAICLGD